MARSDIQVSLVGFVGSTVTLTARNPLATPETARIGDTAILAGGSTVTLMSQPLAFAFGTDASSHAHSPREAMTPPWLRTLHESWLRWCGRATEPWSSLSARFVWWSLPTRRQVQSRHFLTCHALHLVGGWCSPRDGTRRLSASGTESTSILPSNLATSAPFRVTTTVGTWRMLNSR